MRLARIITLTVIFLLLCTSCKKQNKIDNIEKKIINEFEIEQPTQTPTIDKEVAFEIKKNPDIEIISNRKYFELEKNTTSIEYKIKYSNDGQLIALFDSSGNIKIFETQNMKMLTSYYRPGYVDKIDFSSNNEYIIAGFSYFEKCFFVVWNIKTNEQILTKTYNPMQTAVSFQKIQFLENSNLLFIWTYHGGCCGFYSNVLHLYDLVTGKQFKDITGSIPELSSGIIFDYFFTDNAHQIYILSSNGWCVSWDIAKMQKVKSFRVNKKHIERKFDYSNDHKLLAVFDGKIVSITNIDSLKTKNLNFFPQNLIKLWIINKSEILYENYSGIYKANIITETITKLLNKDNYDSFTFNQKTKSYAKIQNNIFNIASFNNPDKQIKYNLKSKKDLIDVLKVNTKNQLIIKCAESFYKTDLSNIVSQQKIKMSFVKELELLSENADIDINDFISKLNLTYIYNQSTNKSHIEYQLYDKMITIPIDSYSNTDPEIKITNDKKYIIIKRTHTETPSPYYNYYISDINYTEKLSHIPLGSNSNEASIYYLQNLEYFIFCSLDSKKILRAHDLKILKEINSSSLFGMSNDNQLIAYITKNGTIEIMETENFSIITEIRNIDNSGITSISFTANNKILFLSKNNSRIKAINVSDSEIYGDFKFLSNGIILVNEIHNDFQKTFTDITKLQIKSVNKNIVNIESQLILEDNFSQIKDNLNIFNLDEAYLKIPKVELPIHSKELFLVLGSEKPDTCEHYLPFNDKYITVFSVNSIQKGNYYYFRFMEQGGKEIWGKKIEGLKWPKILLDDTGLSMAGVISGGWPTLIKLSNNFEIESQLTYYADFGNPAVNHFCKLADNSYILGIGRQGSGSELLAKIGGTGNIEWQYKLKYNEAPIRIMQLLDCKDYGFYAFGKGYNEDEGKTFYFISKISNDRRIKWSISPIIKGRNAFLGNIKMSYLRNGNIFIICSIYNSYNSNNIIMVLDKAGNLLKSYKIKTDLKNSSFIKSIELTNGNFIFGYRQYDKYIDTTNIHFFESNLNGKIIKKYQFGSYLKESMNNFYVDDEYNLLIAGDTTSFADIDSKDAFIIRVPLNDIGENEIKNTYIQNSEVTYSIEGMDLELSDKKYSIETEEHDYKIFDYPFKVENIKERDIHIKDILN